MRIKSFNRLKSLLWLISITLIGICFASPRARAQQITATLVGTVTDAQGAAIPGASVEARNVATGFTSTAVTDGQGVYRLNFLPVGEYVVEVTAPGFKTYIQHQVALSIDQTQRVDVTLAVGATTSRVVVTDAPPMVNTTSAQLGLTLGTRDIEELPLVNRNVYSQLSLTPGIQSFNNSFVFGLPSQDTVFNGGFDAGLPQVSYYFDGGLNMTGMRNAGAVMPEPDALQEFRVETSNYSAAYGRYSSAVVTAVAKSGTNSFHGSLFEFLRNENLNATPVDATSKGPLNRNQFGGTLGGPIKQDKLFFFFSYGGLRQTSNEFLNGAVVPTAQERAGNFSGDKKIPIDPTTGQPFDYNGILGNIPPDRLDPTVQNILTQKIPLPNAADNGWAGFFPDSWDSDEFLGKVDYQLSPSQRINIDYFNVQNTMDTSSGGNLVWTNRHWFDRQQNVDIGDTKTLNARMVNQFWLSYIRSDGGRKNLPQTPLGTFGSSFVAQGAATLPAINVTGFFNLAVGSDGPGTINNFYNVRDMLTDDVGRNALTFGAEMSLNKDIQLTNLTNFGSFSFSGNETGNALADFILGLPVNMHQSSPANAQDNMWYYGFFLEDDVRLNSRVTVNLGIRYDLQTSPTTPTNAQATFVQGRQSTVVPTAPEGLLFPGDKGISRGIVPLRTHHISPRVGITWDPFGNGKTAVRAGFGIFYGGVGGNQWNNAADFQPFALDQTFNNIKSFTDVYGNFPGGVSPFPYYFDPSNPRFIPHAEVAGMSLDYQWPYSYQTNVAIERGLTRNLSMTVAYLGSFGRDIPVALDKNYPIYTPGATTKTIDTRRPINPAELGPVTLNTSTSSSNYNALQVTALRRFTEHFSARGYFVWSKSLWSIPASTRADNAKLQDYSLPTQDGGRTDFDQRLSASISGIWNVDYYRGNSTALHWIANGWEISPIITFHSGDPLNLLTGPDVNADGYTTDRPNLVPDQNPFLDPNRGRTQAMAAWFNTAAFRPNAPGQGIGPDGVDGNTPRNYLTGPGFRNIDLGVYRTFNIAERAKLQLRGEATNAFNIVSLSDPNLTESSSHFGRITSGQDMRQIQIGARLTF